MIKHDYLKHNHQLGNTEKKIKNEIRKDQAENMYNLQSPQHGKQ